MRVPTTIRWGIGLAAATAVISGVSIYLNGVYIHEFPSPTVLAAVRNSLVGVVLLALLAGSPAARHEARHISRRQIAGLLALGLIGGSVPFALFFNGLAAASSPSAAFIQKTLFIWVAVLAVPFLGERLGGAQLVALVVLLGGSWLLGAPSGLSAGRGELMIVAATGLWAVEVILAKRLLGSLGSQVVGTGRMLIGGALLLAFVLASGQAGSIPAVTLAGWAAIAVTTVLLTGYVLTWFAALKRAPASLVTSVLVGGAVITGALNAIGNGASLQGAQVGGWALIVAGVAVLGAATLLRRGSGPAQPARLDSLPGS